MKTTENIDYFKYRSLVFYVFIANVTLAIFGVAFFRDIYFIYSMVLVAYVIFKYFQMAFVLLYVNYKFAKSMDSFRKRQLEKYISAKQITQVFVIPSYCEEDETLRNTLLKIANHSRALDYCVFLAM